MTGIFNFNNKPKSKRDVKQYRRINKNGILVMVVVVFLFFLFNKNPAGYSMFDKLTGRYSRPVHSTLTKEQASKITVLIDAGHGGFDNGATSDYVGKTEAALNLEVAKRLEKELKEIGFVVEMIRDDENAVGENKNDDMKNRQDKINKSNADILVSIHMNTHQDKDVNGPIVFYMPGSNNGSNLAGLVQDSMNSELRPDSPKSPQSKNFLVLRSGDMPAILVECGFITNKKEARKLESSAYQIRIAQSISWGIMDYFAQKI